MMVKSVLMLPLLILMTAVVTPLTAKDIYSSLQDSLLKNNTPHEIARRLFEEYLKGYMTVSDSSTALEKYEILSISKPTLWDEEMFEKKVELPEMSQKELDLGKPMISRVLYSVKPVTEKGFYWKAGNGHERESGWIERKHDFIWIRKIGASFCIYNLGTGP